MAAGRQAFDSLKTGVNTLLEFISIQCWVFDKYLDNVIISDPYNYTLKLK